jgi:glutathione S-transferase
MSTTQTTERGSGAAFEAPYFDRVRERTSPRVNRRIDLSTAASLDRFVDADPATIARHLDDLDREWDIDRAVMAVFAGAGGIAGLLSLGRWLSGKKPGRAAAVLAVQLGFLFHHARSGWCPPVAVLRRLGFRTRMEIEEEKRALLALADRPAEATESVLVIESA